MSQPKFRIYPSLLDAFQNLLDYELVAEEAWNKVSEAAHDRGEHLDKEVGDYVLSPDEMYDHLEQTLLDSVNRVDGVPSEAADKGTCFNEVVDCLIHNIPCGREDMTITSLRTDEGYPYAIRATLDGFEFLFDVNLCRKAARYFAGSLSQVMLQAPISTKYGEVLLYGYLDEWRHDKIYDIKTTGYYNYGKFERKWQKHVYPYCAIESGLTTEVSEFEYTIYKLTKPTSTNKIIRGEQYKECYTYDHETSTIALRMMCERFIEWLITQDEAGNITHRRIFNQQ